MHCYLILLVLFVTDKFDVVYLIKYYESDPFDADVDVSGGENYEALKEITRTVVRDSMIEAQKELQEEFTSNENTPIMSKNDTGYSRFNTPKVSGSLLHLYHSSAVMIKGLQIILYKNIHRYNYAPKTFMKLLFKRKFRLLGACEKTSNEKVCAKYTSRKLDFRTVDGLCNNLKHPTWGKAFTTYTRFVFPNYADGIHEPPISSDGSELSSARVASLILFPSKVSPDKSLTMMASEMSQILSHDSTMQIMDSTKSGPIMCCDTHNSNILPEHKRHRDCMPIKIGKYDPYYSKYGQRCMNFIRSITAPRTDCNFGPAEQINGASSYLDCGFVYGNTKELAKSLRTHKGGRLLYSSSHGEEMLPHSPSNYPDLKQDENICYKAGDSRVNQNPHLTTLQTIFVREHNRIATALHSLNCNWKDERIFQETRRIIIALYQHIVYREYLPLLLGSTFINEIFSKSDQNGFTNVYNNRINAAYINSMSIAFRCLHSTIPNDVRTYTNNCTVLSKHEFSDLILKPSIVGNNCDGILNSLSCRAMMKMDTHVTSEVTNKLFKSGHPYGLDLMALDIQRGRDNGLPGYNVYRKLCGLQTIECFEDLIPSMGEDRVERLYRAYKDVDDIDLIVGIMYEKPVKGSKFGPVASCIFQEQFYRLMIGDRYFYTNKNQSYPFTSGQLKEIRKMTMAKLICENGKNIEYIQKNVFQVQSKSNPRTKCNKLSSIDLTHWEE